MRFKVKDLLITILPKKTVIADAECDDDCGATERGRCAACTPRTDAGFDCGRCTPRTDPVGICGGCTPLTDPTGFRCGGCTPLTDLTGLRCGGCTPLTDPTGLRATDRPGVFDIESHRQELERQLRALRAYEEALEEEPSKDDLERAIEALRKDEKRLEEALDGVRSLRRELEERLRDKDGGDKDEG